MTRPAYVFILPEISREIFSYEKKIELDEPQADGMPLHVSPSSDKNTWRSEIIFRAAEILTLLSRFFFLSLVFLIRRRFPLIGDQRNWKPSSVEFRRMSQQRGCFATAKGEKFRNSAKKPSCRWKNGGRGRSYTSLGLCIANLNVSVPNKERIHALFHKQERPKMKSYRNSN